MGFPLIPTTMHLFTLLIGGILPAMAAPVRGAEPAATPAVPESGMGEIIILTTPDGANLPATAAVDDFPLLVRLDKDTFDFAQAKAHGEDIRFTGSTGAPLAFQIEYWDPVQGTASLWVRIPHIEGNARQAIHIHWGSADAPGESNAKAVFNESNGYLSVWHMVDPVTDEVGTLESKDVGTTTTGGIIGKARHFAGGQGIFCGDKIVNYPAGAGPHSSEAWFRAEKANGKILAWGNEKRQGKVVVDFASPPHINIGCYFSGADVAGGSVLPMSEWTHVMHTYQDGDSRIYVNGRLDGVSTNKESPLELTRPARMWIGGWYDDYDFLGDIDEVRISKVTRSADWARLQYENQKPLQTLTGTIIQPGDGLSVSPPQVTVAEGQSATLSAKAGGALKVYWILKANGAETIVSTDRFSFTFDAGRVTGDQAATLQFKAVYPDGVKTRDIPISIKEDIQEPVFTLKAPATWDGRTPVEVLPLVTNLSAMQTKHAAELKVAWKISDIAVIKEATPENLILKRAQNSGSMTVTATLSNGGKPTTQSATILVTEPKDDPWIARTPAESEQPEDSQFYARDDKNEGTLYYNGKLTEAADSVFLKVYADEKPYKNESARPTAGRAYAFVVKLKPGLIKYKVEFGTRTGGRETILRTVSNLVCGDAYLVNGQSNAVATSWGDQDFPETSEWIRSYGSTGGDPGSVRWGPAIRRSKGERVAIGYWAFDLATKLVANHRIPICIINGAVGGTRIDQHQRHPQNDEDLTTIYGRLLWRVRQARLTHGIRGIFWHQGENDQGADGPTGGYGWETYRQYFIDLAAAWKQDYPNIRHYYLFQIWPYSCAMGRDGSDSRLREVQRTLPGAFSNMSIMSTLGIDPPGSCHYPPEGYAEFARLIAPLVGQYNYGILSPSSITPPDLKQVRYTGGNQDEIVMEFDQPVKWNNALASQFYLDGEKGKVASGSVAGNKLILKLTKSSAAQNITYLDGKSWNRDTLLRGDNGIAALTFCEVPVGPAESAR